MKLKHFLIIAPLCYLASACGSSSTDEPEKPDVPDTPSEKVRDWTVIYTESSHQSPNWIEVRNNSEECLAWKSLYKDYLIDHSATGTNERWIWAFTHKDCTEKELTDKIHQFISFTKMPEPNAVGRYGIDLYTAEADYGDFTVEYSCNPNAAFEEGEKSGWVIEFSQHRYDAPGQTYVKPAGYDEWVQSNSNNLSYSVKDNNNQSYTWTIYSENVDDDFINNKVIPFVLWSKGESASPQNSSYDWFSVNIHKYGHPESKRYGKLIH